MNGGIAEVGCYGIPAVCSVDAFKVLGNLVKRFVPPDALPTIRSAADRMLQPVLIVVQVLQRNGLRADVPAAERIVFITANV